MRAALRDDIADHDICADGGIGKRDRAAEAAAPARDHGDLIVKRISGGAVMLFSGWFYACPRS
jgi:hypothetical protein